MVYEEKIMRLTNRLWESKYLIGYLALLLSELLLLNRISDLPNSLGNWISKADQIASLSIPSDNFYGPGAAIMLVPFLWAKENLLIATATYFMLGSYGYWKLTSLLENKTLKGIARLALPANFYLIWLINSSQDTVFEFMLLTWSGYFLIRRRYLTFSLITFLLCETRAGYWVYFLGTAALLLANDRIRKNKVKMTKVLAFPLLLIASTFNFVIYESPSPALEGGMTAYFSYSKYHYLSLPKMDMDVFLGGPNGIFSPEYKPEFPEGSTGAEQNKAFQEAALDSMKANKKETILGWMQKFDSYFFDVQKVPHLPGSYVLDIPTKIIKIQDERLSWNLVLGNLVFEIQRTLLVTFGLLAAGLLLASRLFLEKALRIKPKLWFLVLPYLFGVVPGMVMYTETRFKIVSELLLVPLIAEIFSISLQLRKSAKSNLEIRQIDSRLQNQ
jgi:hypothetical protein